MLFFSGRCEKKGIAMDIRQLREWGKRLFGSISANTKKAIAGVISAAMIVTVALVAIPAQAAGNMIADRRRSPSGSRASASRPTHAPRTRVDRQVGVYPRGDAENI